MKAGKNWVCSECGKEVKSKNRPSVCIKEGCESKIFYAKYPDSRVKGGSYQHYNGSGEWEKDANRGMQLEANNNFLRHRGRLKRS
jgi:DNA-directed RNA polymerase subunit RPC12/RpoP